jgi:hypothetical protein
MPYCFLGDFFNPMLFLWYCIHIEHEPPTFEIHDVISLIHMQVGEMGLY